MSSTRLAILYHLKGPDFNQQLQDTQRKSMARIQEKQQSAEMVPEETQILDLIHKDFKQAILNIVK